VGKKSELIVTRELKRKYIKVNDFAWNTESGVIGIVEALVVVDEKLYAVWQLMKTRQVILITASKLRAVWVKAENSDVAE